jgi:hypothetical protein
VAIDGTTALALTIPDQKEIDVTPRRPALVSSTATGLTAADKTKLAQEMVKHRKQLMRSTYPWFPWNDRPFISAQELLQVPAGSSSQMLRDYSVINRGTPNPFDGDGLDPNPTPPGPPVPEPPAARLAKQKAPFGQLLNFLLTGPLPAEVAPPAAVGDPIQLTGGPNYYRLLEYVQVPSRFVGTDTMLTPEVFSDVPNANDPPQSGGNIVNPTDPRFLHQPPFNKVSRERDPGRVNLNTVTSRRIPGDASAQESAQIWSEVFDGIMHRYHDGPDPAQTETGHFGPAWRDVALSRRGYAAIDAAGNSLDKLGTPTFVYPDTLTQGLNPNFPTFVANPFRSPDAGDLVPLVNMTHTGVDATWLRRHHYSAGQDSAWGVAGTNDNGGGVLIDKIREAGYGDDILNVDQASGRLPFESDTARVPLFSETFAAPFYSGERNPGMMYQPTTRMENLVTTRSNVFAVWITIGYFEVEKAPDWNKNENNIQARLGGDVNLYNRIYPEGYTLGKELGSDTGDIHRHRAFYIIDRSVEVGFKPGEDLNVEKTILLQRRID